MDDRKQHWETIYEERKPDQMSWFQTEPTRSLELICATGIAIDAPVIDVGGGASVLIDRLVDLGFKQLTVLDISDNALEYSRARLGEKAAQVHWIVADVTQFASPTSFDLWHDRAVFHFLTDPADRKKYVELLRRVVTSQGHVILASFAIGGPEMCSGLPVCRYDAASISTELGEDFELLREESEVHSTPWKKEQKFAYFLFKRV